MIVKNFLLLQDRKGVDDSQFVRGRIPHYEPVQPALDRYRDHAGIGQFDWADYHLPADAEQKAEEQKPAAAQVNSLDWLC